MRNSFYDDEYPTCELTYATLCVYGDEFDPIAATKVIGIEPSEIQNRDGHRSGWFLSTENKVASRDARRHVIWLIEMATGKEQVFCDLRSQGCDTVVSCYWMSASGHGGPTLSAEIMGRLAELGFDIWFDVYFHGE